MEYNCIHCSSNFEENFCNYCGQKRYKRIDRKYIWDEIQYTLIHFNKGFLFSAKNILKNPGKTAREFVDGDRVNHYKPISLAFVLAGISAFLSINVVKLPKLMEAAMINQKLNSLMLGDLWPFINKYNSFIMLLFVPIVAVFTKLIFKKWGNNFYEHIVMNAFGVSFYLIFCILLLYPSLLFLKSNPNLSLKIAATSFALIPIMMIWFFKGFYADKPLKSIIFKILLLVLLLFVCYIASIFAITIIYILIKGPEGLKYLKAQ